MLLFHSCQNIGSQGSLVVVLAPPLTMGGGVTARSGPYYKVNTQKNSKMSSFYPKLLLMFHVFEITINYFKIENCKGIILKLLASCSGSY